MSVVNQIKSIFKSKGWEWYEKPYKLNIIGVRSRSRNPIKFDDLMVVFWYDDKKKLHTRKYDITTDPSQHILKSAGYNPKGTAFLKQGQYKNAYTIGTHAGKYTALVQRLAPITVYRDVNRKGVLDYDNPTETGYFGVNIHRASTAGDGVTKEIGPWSAGCQVFKNYKDFLEFMSLAKKHSNIHGNKFTYTLIDHKMKTWAALKRGLLFVGAFIALTGLGYIIYKQIKK